MKAELSDAGGRRVAEGHDQILVVDWKDTRVSGRGAIYETGSAIHDFLKSKMGVDVPAYRGELGPLDWILVARACPTPSSAKPAESQDPVALLRRAQKDGATIIIADDADTWLDAMKDATPVTFKGTFKVGSDWVGGQYFAIDHPLFKDLPTNVALNWPYQTVIDYGRTRYGIRMEGEQLVAGCWQSVPMNLGTAVGIIPCGDGKIVVSTLDICSHLNDSAGPADVARKLFCNYLAYAGSTKR